MQIGEFLGQTRHVRCNLSRLEEITETRVAGGLHDVLNAYFKLHNRIALKCIGEVFLYLLKNVAERSHAIAHEMQERAQYSFCSWVWSRILCARQKGPNSRNKRPNRRWFGSDWSGSRSYSNSAIGSLNRSRSIWLLASTKTLPPNVTCCFT